MKKLRLGIVGTGGMGSHHIRSYHDIPEIELVAACDIVPGRAEKASHGNGWENTKPYESYKEMIENEELDAVDICTPNYLHSEVAVFALDHGLHVFSEKPDAVDVTEALKMKEASERNGKVLMVMRNNRYYQASQYMKKFIAEGKCGDIYAGRCGWVRRRGIPGKGGWFTTKAQSGGGPLIDLGVHMIDLSIWLMGNPTPVAVSGCTYNRFAENTASADSSHAGFGEAKEDGTFDVEDLAMGFIKFDNGACLQIEFSWASNIEAERKFVELRGSKAGFTIENENNLKIFGEQDGQLTDDHPESIPVNGHGLNLAHFVDVVLNGAKPDFEPIQGVNMIKILCAIYESARTGKEVIL